MSKPVYKEINSAKINSPSFRLNHGNAVYKFMNLRVGVARNHCIHSSWWQLMEKLKNRIAWLSLSLMRGNKNYFRHLLSQLCCFSERRSRKITKFEALHMLRQSLSRGARSGETQNSNFIRPSLHKDWGNKIFLSPYLTRFFIKNIFSLFVVIYVWPDHKTNKTGKIFKKFTWILRQIIIEKLLGIPEI